MFTCVLLKICLEQITLSMVSARNRIKASTAKPDVWKFLEAIHRQQALQEFNVSQQRLGKNIVKPNENFARIKRIVCSCADYNPFEYLEAIASNTVF